MENWNLPFILNANVRSIIHRFLQELDLNILHDTDSENGEGNHTDDFVEDDLLLEDVSEEEEQPSNGEGDIPIIASEIVIFPSRDRMKRYRNKWTTTGTDDFSLRKRFNSSASIRRDRNRWRSRSPVILRNRAGST
ncbi:hypothetical protein QE152_g21873 [Popillia japonica]|uniref:Uncharacterized protein n=1 Tax=Popillia japonica TaxID=7064 RepID=A0AAW1KMQ6_POPJA